MRPMTKTLSTPTRPPRLSVPIPPDILVVFERLGKAGNMSTGKAVAEWLSDTVEAAEFMATKMEQARAAPKVVMREMHAYALGLADETGEMMRKIQAKGKADREGAPGAALARTSDTARTATAPNPPPCNTGGKVPKNTSTAKRGKLA